MGVWVNGSYTFGDIDSTFDAVGFEYDTWGTSAGVDFRLTDNLIVGTAFTYYTSEADIDHHGGDVDADSYTGSIYATFYHGEGFYINGIASYGEGDLDIKRNIQYTIPAETVNTEAKGTPGSQQYSVGLGTGYTFNIEGFTITPFARFNYLEYGVDSYSEKGGTGWGLRYSDQKVRSLKTVLGSQASYAYSLPFGVLLSQVHGEWIHEYKDSKRKYRATYRVVA